MNTMTCNCGRELPLDANDFAACSKAVGGCGAVWSLYRRGGIAYCNPKTQYRYDPKLKKLVPAV